MRPCPYVLADMPDVQLDGFLMSSVEGHDLIARTIMESGWWSYELPLPALLYHCALAWPGTLLDVGSNSGFYALLHASIDPTHRVIAFEPNPAVRSVLEANVALNLYGPRISVRAEAVGARSEQADLFVPFPEHGLLECRASLESDFCQVHEAVLRVPATTLDEVALTDSSVSILKIDVEAHEAKVFAGARELIAEHRPIIALGLLGKDFASLNAFVTAERYRSVLLVGLDAIVKRSLAHDARGWNHVLVPEEKWQAFEAILSTIGLSLLNEA